MSMSQKALLHLREVSMTEMELVFAKAERVEVVADLATFGLLWSLELSEIEESIWYYVPALHTPDTNQGMAWKNDLSYRCWCCQMTVLRERVVGARMIIIVVVVAVLTPRCRVNGIRHHWCYCRRFSSENNSFSIYQVLVQLCKGDRGITSMNRINFWLIIFKESR